MLQPQLRENNQQLQTGNMSNTFPRKLMQHTFHSERTAVTKFDQNSLEQKHYNSQLISNNSNIST